MLSFGSSSEFFDILYSDKGTSGPDPWIAGLSADPDSNGALGAVSRQTTKPRQNVKTINNFMAEIEMWHLFAINFWLICKQTRQIYCFWHNDINDIVG